jgi:hypothetical protein
MRSATVWVQNVVLGNKVGCYGIVTVSVLSKTDIVKIDCNCLFEQLMY